jgi:hypothetical protein
MMGDPAMAPISMRYVFTLPDDTKTTFLVHLDPEDLSLVHTAEKPPPPWTSLDFHQCPNCTLSIQTHPQCPLAMSLMDIIEGFESLVSYDVVQVEVTVSDKKTSTTTSVQQGVGSLMGLVIAASGCPHTAYFRPMARFHNPFCEEEETVYRAASMYLLAQYLLKQEGKPAELGLEGLTKIYAQVQTVNASVVKRIRAASKTDSALNALIVLDMFARILPDMAEESLEDIRHLFKPFLFPENL